MPAASCAADLWGLAGNFLGSSASSAAASAGLPAWSSTLALAEHGEIGAGETRDGCRRGKVGLRLGEFLLPHERQPQPQPHLQGKLVPGQGRSGEELLERGDCLGVLALFLLGRPQGVIGVGRNRAAGEAGDDLLIGVDRRLGLARGGKRFTLVVKGPGRVLALRVLGGNRAQGVGRRLEVLSPLRLRGRLVAGHGQVVLRPSALENEGYLFKSV